ncbi:carboxylesterase/lipase family protein [Gordonia sp. CPCC 205333]|uniref:carboxylesterase/lipase family protein n=1 Tax=Gordonia sp. CPCC 205333 TaxID=3140790 RepID=UPI003AF3E000
MTVNDVNVVTTQGVVAGVRGRRTRAGTTSWKGIPFAAPPVAGRRFAAPEPAPKWPGVRNADEYGKAEIQRKEVTAVAPGKFWPMGEDCLTLNIFAPQRTSAGPRPVMVFIHGGAYILGTTATPLYDGALLARDGDVIVVTVQYRFGAFGYLDFSAYSTPEKTFSNNNGLRDQVAALEWVRDNIAAFGGDPANVTIFGESAGGSAVTALMATPAAEGLFAKVISESPALDLVMDQDEADVFADEFLRLLQDPQRKSRTMERTEEPISPEHAQKLLAQASAREIHEATERLTRFAVRAGARATIPFGPVVDGEYLPKRPVQAALAGETHRVPLIIGSNKDEGNLFTKLWNILPEGEQALIGVQDPAHRAALSAVYNDGHPRANIRLAGDAVFWGPMMPFVEGHMRHAPTFVYRYDFNPKVLRWTGFGATHATELFAVFGAYRMALGAGLALGEWRRTARITRQVQRHWSVFARTGTPEKQWPAYDEATRSVMILDVPPRVESNPQSARRETWQKVHQLVG